MQDTAWLDTHLSHIPHIGEAWDTVSDACCLLCCCTLSQLRQPCAAVYQVDEPEFTVGAQHATLANKGNEASAYLQVRSGIAWLCSVCAQACSHYASMHALAVPMLAITETFWMPE